MQSRFLETDAETVCPLAGAGMDTDFWLKYTWWSAGAQAPPSVHDCESGVDVATSTSPEYVQSSFMRKFARVYVPCPPLDTDGTPLWWKYAVVCTSSHCEPPSQLPPAEFIAGVSFRT